MHFTAFSAFENDHGHGRMSDMVSRLAQARNENVSVAQIALKVEFVWEVLRLCIVNGYFLCDKGLHPRTFESIVVYRWRADLKAWVGRWLFNAQIEKIEITHFIGKRAYDARRIAEVLTMTEDDVEIRQQGWTTFKMTSR